MAGSAFHLTGLPIVDNEDREERIAIRIESGMSVSEATKLTEAEIAKEASDAKDPVKRAKKLQERIKRENLKPHGFIGYRD